MKIIDHINLATFEVKVKVKVQVFASSLRNYCNSPLSTNESPPHQALHLLDFQDLL